MADSPNIALLHPFHWEEVRRGTERLVSELSGGLIEDGYRVVLITTHGGGPTSTVEAGMPIIRNRRPTVRLPAFRRHQLSHIPFAYSSLRRGGFDLAHAFHPADALAAVGWAKRVGRPAVFTVPAFPPRHGSRARLSTLRRVFTGADAVVAPTEAVSDEIQGLFPGTRTRLIPPGVDLERFTPGAGGRATQPTIFCAAEIEEPRKRVELVVTAFSLLRRERPEARLVLANPYPHRTEFPHWASGPGIDIRGIRDDNDLVNAYREAWVSVLAARDEPFGLVLVESLACGTPVVGSSAGGIPEIIVGDEIGELFDGEEPDTLAAALHSVLELATEDDIVERCRRRAADFELRRCIEEYERLYGELLDRPA
ncbi:MAG: glycosyltransferase family 4 protein [Actinomycetota bacterium]